MTQIDSQNQVPPKHSLHLYHYWRSSCSWRVRWALIHKGVSYEETPINLLTGEQKSQNYLAINPQGNVPSLKVDGKVYCESMAMLEWIEETYPHNSLLPNNPQDRMIVRQICQMIVSGTQPLQNLSVMKAFSTVHEEQQAWSKKWIAEGLSKVEKMLQKYAGSYAVGGELTFADLCIVPQVYNAKRFAVDPSLFPIAIKIYDRCLKLHACQKAAPENQASAIPN